MRLAQAAILPFVAVLLVTGCGSGTASPGPSVSAAPSASLTAPVRAVPVPVDPSLLAFLPATLGGLARQADPQVDAGLATSPGLANVARSFATAVYIDPATGDFAYASVVRLRTGTIDEATYRDWRDTFDAGACEQAGGVARRAETEVNGRQTFVATCAEGVRTYHVVLVAPGLLVSVSSLGQRLLGEQLITGLAP